MDEVAENSDELMERYLEGEEISHAEIVTALKKGVTEGHLFPVTCGVATRNLGTNRLLEALVEDLPSPAMRGGGQRARRRRASRSRSSPTRIGRAARVRLQDHRRPLHRPDQHAARLLGRAELRLARRTTRSSDRRSGSASSRRPRARRWRRSTSSGRATSARSRSCARPAPATSSPPRRPRSGSAPLDLPAPVMAFAYEPKSKGDEEKAATAIRRLSEEDPTLDVHRDPETGRADHRRADPGPRRGDRRPDQEPLRRRDRAAPAAGALHRDDPQARPRPTAATRSRPAAAASSATATSRSSRTSRGRASSS